MDLTTIADNFYCPSPTTLMIYTSIIGAMLVRIVAGFWPQHLVLYIWGVMWCLAFFDSAGVFGPMLLRQDSSDTSD
jgi:uncharacterized protein involved in response to NO